MSLKSKPLVIEGTFTEVKEEPTENKALVVLKPKCWCVGRNYKEHIVGEPFCHFTPSRLPPTIESQPQSGVPTQVVSKTGTVSSMTDFPVCSSGVTSPVTFDEDLLMSCINRAVTKTPSDFVSLLDEGRVNPTQARHINNELRSMGYCISEEPW